MSDRCFLCGGQLVNGKCVSCGLDNSKNDKKYRLNTHNDNGAHFHDGDCEDGVNKPRPHVFGRKKKQAPQTEVFDYKKLLEEEKKKVHSGSSYRKQKKAAVSAAAGKKARENTGTLKGQGRTRGSLLAGILFLIILWLAAYGRPALYRTWWMLRYRLRQLTGYSDTLRTAGAGEDGSLAGDAKIQYDPENAAYYESELDNGFYEVGYDLPAGNFQFFCDAGETQDVSGTVYYYTDEGLQSFALLASPAAIRRMEDENISSTPVADAVGTCTDQMTLQEGNRILLEFFDEGTIRVDGYADSLKLNSHPHQDIQDKVVVKNGMVAGNDFVPGIYDISLNPKADTYFSLVTLNSGNRKNGSRTYYLTSAGMKYRRIPFEEGMSVSLDKQYKGSILLTPSF